MIYLDYQATSPLAPEAWSAMRAWLDPDVEGSHANPHSAHAAGRAAAAAVAVAREQISALLPPGGRLVFTSGATEAINLAMAGCLPDRARQGRNRITLVETEHAAVLDCAHALSAQGFAIDSVPVEPDGRVDPDRFRLGISDRTTLAAVMQVNNEIGVIQPVEALARIAHDAGALFLCDAVQGFGRMAAPASADMIAISAHKIHGPKGIGALWFRDVALNPIIHGGGQEMGLRSGTLSPALCAGFGAAAALAAERMLADAAHVGRLWALAIARLDGWTINGSTEQRYRGNLNIRREGLDAARLISDARGIALSLGSACASGSGRPSHVLNALGLSAQAARSSLRLGWGRYTQEAELEEALHIINRLAKEQGALP